MLVNKDSHQRETITKWPIWLALTRFNQGSLKGESHRLIKTQIGHARDFAWYRGQRPSPARVILSRERVQIHAGENLCSYATSPPHFRVRELLLCDIFITRAGDGRWPRYQAKSLACPGCGESVVAAILSSRMEQSYCTSGLFRFQARFLTSSAPIWTITHYLRMCITQRITLYAPSVVTSMSLRGGHFQKLKI